MRWCVSRIYGYSPLYNETYAIADPGNGLLRRAQEAECQQAALLETAPLESPSNDALAEYVEVKYEQGERLEDRLENLIDLGRIFKTGRAIGRF